MSRPHPFRPRVPPRARRESGYALLMIFLLAAIVALTLYQVIPRVAFESERDKEQLLIDRGEQYKRAIQLYYRKLQRYPVKMEDLESTNNIRFLRQRYIDPMTGKDEWRLIHVGPGGVFIDSLTQKKTTTTQKNSAPNTFITESGAIGDTGLGTTQAINPGLRRRPSDGGGGAPIDPNGPIPPDPFSQNNGNGANSNGGLGNSGLANSGIPVSSGDPGLAGTGNSQNAANPGALPSGAPGTTSNGTNAAALIGQMLTGPRPGGPPPGIILPSSNNGDNNSFPQASNPTNATGGPGSPFGAPSSNGTAGTGNGASGQVLAGSFAGVASTAQRPSIKSYNDHQKFNEWEFIYDYSKDIAKAVGLPVSGSGANAVPGQTGNGLGTPIGGAGAGGSGTSSGGSGAGGSSAFGNNSGGQSSGTGSTTTPAPSQ